MSHWWNSLSSTQRSAIIAFTGSGCGLILSTVVPYLQSLDRPCCMALGAILSVAVNAFQEAFLKAKQFPSPVADSRTLDSATSHDG